MASQKRERELARAKYERQQERRAANSGNAKRNQRIAAIGVVGGIALIAIGAVIFNATSSDTETDTIASETELSESEEALVPDESAPEGESAEDPAVTDDQPVDDPAAGESGVLDCQPPGEPRPDDITFPDGPLASDTVATTLTLNTNCGDIVISLDPAAPATLESAVFLSESGFYNNTLCHRLTTEGIYVLQCGDPAGNGTGGPGYQIPDENLPAEGEANYPAGSVAMANAGPGTGGSQFFIVYQDTTLPSNYSLWGTVTQGLDIVTEVASVGVQGGLTDGPPLQPVFINTATVS